MIRARRHMFRCCAMLVLGVVVVTAPSGSVAQQTRPASAKVNGAYKLIFAGHFTGRGTAAVGQKSVVITAQVADDAGASGNFHAKCVRNGNLFSGTGSGPSGGTITVKGRLDPANKSLSSPRLSFTYVASNAEAGRAAGNRPAP